MRPFAAPVCVALLAAACGSTAPYTMASAALNTGIALGASAYQRSAGGCYATCTAGTVCNPNTGYCERDPLPTCAGGVGCTSAAREPLQVDQLARQPGSALGPTIGVTPETGRAPSPPPASGPPPSAPATSP